MTQQPMPSPASADDSQLIPALKDCLAALEAGAPIPREEILGRYPDLGDSFAECLEGLELIQAVAADLSHSGGDSGVASGRAHSGIPLGDFQIVREIGRGGMGVVHEAEQMSLKRRVALKVLPFAATMDPRQLQRFKNEALAAASLDHPHIVPVYGVGCERGVHYYAMKLIEGQTLADLVRELSHPDADSGAPAFSQDDATTAYQGEDPRARSATRSTAIADTTEPRCLGRVYFDRVARLGIQAAEALEHAHSLGIVHRDIKPANLMLDSQGNLWITDFGLARTEQDSGLTISGDLLGTLRYMSPEQALARHGLVDHRTDIYSLGATLYELLTLKPAIGGEDRKEVLGNIAFEEPIAPRRIHSDVPFDLETVVLKGLAKDAAERYATAQELADDLRCWRESRPIRARRQGFFNRAGKFVRRHRAATATAAISFLLILVLFSIGLGIVLGERRQRENRAKEAVRVALNEAVEKLKMDQSHDALSAALRAEALAKQASDLPELQARVQGALKDVRMLLTLESMLILSTGDTEKEFYLNEEDKLYERAFRNYGIDILALPVDEIRRRIRGSVIRAQLESFLETWGVVRLLAKGVGDSGTEKVMTAAVRVVAVRNRARLLAIILQSKSSKRAPLRRALSLEGVPPRLLAFTVLLASLEDAQQNRIFDYLRAVQSARPNDYWCNYALGQALLESKRHDESIQFCRVAVALRPSCPGANHNMGVALYQKQKYNEAMAYLQKSIRLKNDVWKSHAALGRVFYEKKDLPAAIACYRKAVQVAPKNWGNHHRLGVALREKGRLDEAIAALQTAIRLKSDAQGTHAVLGYALQEKGRLDEAIQSYRTAIRLKKDDFQSHNNLGLMLFKKRQWDLAIASLQEAIRWNPQYAKAHYHLGVVLSAQGKHKQAVPELQKSIELDATYAAAHHELGRALLRLRQHAAAIPAFRTAIKLDPKWGSPYGMLGACLARTNKLDEAMATFQQAIALTPERAESYFDLGQVYRMKGQSGEALKLFRKAIHLKPNAEKMLNYLAWFLATCPDRELRNAREAIGYAQRAVKLKPKRGWAWDTLGVAYYKAGEWPAALEALNRSAALEKQTLPSTAFFMAMTHWRLGDKTAAKSWFDKGARLMKQQKPIDPQVQRFHAEAAKLLGLQKSEKEPGEKPL